MTLEENVFRKIKIDSSKLKAFGFQENKNGWFYQQDFLNGDFTAELTVSTNLKLTGKVIENSFGDEYLQLRVKNAAGAYVQQVRDAYLELLKEVAMKIGIPTPFEDNQANRIALNIVSKYGDAPDFPWATDEYSDAAVFRHPDNNKWYALIMYTAETNLKTAEEKLAAKQSGKSSQKKKSPPAENVKKLNIINLKINPENGPVLQKEKGIYPSFHMSQKHWISVRLDETLSDKRIMELISDSFDLTEKKSRPRSIKTESLDKLIEKEEL